MRSAVVVGGGIAGLVAARTLAGSGLDVTVLEGTQRWGGKLAAATVGGLRLDTGAESVLARRPEALELIHDLGLDADLAHPTPARPAVLVGGRVQPLPPTLLGVPVEVVALAAVLTTAGLERAAAEPGIAAQPLAADVAIGDYVEQRFGPEVTDRLLEPMLGGVYAGRSRSLSFEAVAPELFHRARSGGSLLEHAAATARSGRQGPVFAGVRGGLARVAEALVDDLARSGVTLRSGFTAREVERLAGGFRIAGTASRGPESLRADALLLAAPAAASGRLISGLIPAAGDFANVPYASVAVVTLVVRGIAPTDSGLLVPPAELPTIKALTYSSAKWAWVSDATAEVWGPRTAVVRASVGRWGEASKLQVDDEALLARTFAEAAGLPGWERADLVGGLVTRWGGGLPQYLVGHRALVDRVRREVAAVPGLGVAGAALDGPGIAACIATARAAAAMVVAGLGGRPVA